MNKRLQEQVDNVLNRLSVPITILDADSDRLPDGMPLSTLRLTEGEARAMLGSLYMAVQQPRIVLTCAEQHCRSLPSSMTSSRNWSSTA